MASARRIRFSFGMIAAGLVALGVTPLAAPPALAQPADQVIGDIRVRGAGVVGVGGQWFHLFGATTFERDETCHLGNAPYQCGLIGQGKLAEISAGQQYICFLQDFSGDSRRFGTCAPYDFVARAPVAGGIDLATAWVRSGWAFAHRVHTEALVADEESARVAKRGLWAGTTPPIHPAPLREIVGAASALDGNTLRVGGVLVRLAGTDAPEGPQSCSLGPGRGSYFCGIVARAWLTELTMGKRIYCSIERRAEDERNFGTCGVDNAAGNGFRQGEVSLNETMVRNGWAVADRRTGTAYIDAQIAADNDNAGLWQGVFTMPRDWRLGWR